MTPMNVDGRDHKVGRDAVAGGDSVDDVDVLVVGAGPAGASAALAALRARPGARVTMVDAEPLGRDKTCGDGVAPHALAELAQLGVHDVVTGYGPIARLDLRTPGGARVVAEPPQPGHVVPRRVLDARLASAAVEAGAALVRHRVRRVEVRSDRVVLDGVLSGRVVIAADGANSAVRRAIGLPRNPDDHLALAVRGYAAAHQEPGDDPGPSQLIDMQDDAWPAYAWSFPLVDGSGQANVGYGRLRSRLSGRGDLWGELERLRPDQPATDLKAHHLPLSTWRPPQPDGRVLLVGDAASLINPLTGEGIFYAVRSGRLAGAAAVTPGGRAAGAVYRRALARSLGRHLRHTSMLSRLSRHRGVLEAGLVATSGRPALLDRLVDVGLGDGLVPAAVLSRTAQAYLRRRIA
jgi:menaquinone-9 beta-reductase